LLRRGPAVAAQPPVPIEVGADCPVERCVSVDIREHLLAGHSEAEHRPLTAAFVHFGGTDELLEREGPDAHADALEHCPGPLPLRIGVNRGRIFVADFGPPYRRTYSVKGDAVNLAARLMAKAEPGQIVASAEVLERSRRRFDVVAIEPFAAKGKSEPVRAF